MLELFAAGGLGAARAVERVGISTGQPLTWMVTLGVLSVLPIALVTLTSFSKISIVLSLLRSALGTQQAPPTLVLTGLAAVLTAHIMAPVMQKSFDAYAGARAGEHWEVSVKSTLAPLSGFLEQHAGEDERRMFVELARELRPESERAALNERSIAIIAPAFVITELKEALQIGFMVCLPFLVLDMVVANVLVALGMQTLSPTQVSLPFKLLLFVAVDGWALLARGLALGYRGVA
jgi:type III secretion protein R